MTAHRAVAKRHVGDGPRLSRRVFVAATVAAAASVASGCAGEDEPVIRPAGVPLGPFGKESTAEEVLAGIDLGGRTILVTGGTSGLGLESARTMLARGARVLLTGRTAERARAACTPLGAGCTPLALELEEPESIVACAREVRALGTPIDVLLCNAGIMAQGERRTVRGLEQHFAVNHLGHFLLANLLLEQVRAAPQGRVVVVASSAYKWAPPAGIEFDNLSGEREFTANRAYGQSKLANALFSLELARRLQGTTATSNSVNPGPVDTDLWRHFPAWQRALMAPIKGFLLKSPAEGAATQAYVASAPALAGISGHYFEDCNPVEPPPQVRDAALAQQLWATSEELCAPYLGA